MYAFKDSMWQKTLKNFAKFLSTKQGRRLVKTNRRSSWGRKEYKNRYETVNARRVWKTVRAINMVQLKQQQWQNRTEQQVPGVRAALRIGFNRRLLITLFQIPFSFPVRSWINLTWPRLKIYTVTQRRWFTPDTLSCLDAFNIPNFYFFVPSHWIFKHMHWALNIDKKITNCTV
jgi:hypothetical protein